MLATKIKWLRLFLFVLLGALLSEGWVFPFALAQGKAPRAIEAYKSDFGKLRRAGRTREGFAVIDEALKHYKNDADLLNMRALASLDKNDYQAVLVDTDRAIALAPDFIGPYSTKASALFALGRRQETLRCLDRAVALNQDRFSFPYSQRGNVYFILGDKKKAQEDLRKAIKISPRDARARQLQGDLYYSAGHYPQALREYEIAAVCAPGLSDIVYGRAAIRLKMNDRVGALRDLDLALKLRPDQKELLNSRGVLAFNLGDFEEAMQDMHAAMILPSGAGCGSRSSPRHSTKTGSYARLLDGYDKLIRMSPGEADSYYNRGLLLLCSGQDRRAADDFVKFLELKKWQGRGVFSGATALHCAYLRLGKAEEAAAVVSQSLSQCQSWPRPVLLYLGGKLKEPQLFAALKRQDYLTFAHCYVALALQSHGQKAAAKKHFDWVEKHGSTQMDEYFLSLSLR